MKNASIDNEFFNTLDPIIIAVGRLTPIKGYWHLLRIFSEIRKKIPCKLVFCGNGELLDSLLKLSMDLHVSDDVLFLGWCDNPYKYISKSTVFALPSLSEALPTVLVEAMVCGCPIVSTDCNYGPREILDGGKCGILTKTLDDHNLPANEPLTNAERDMMEKLFMVIQNPELQKLLVTNGIKRSLEFDTELSARKYIEIINDTCV